MKILLFIFLSGCGYYQPPRNLTYPRTQTGYETDWKQIEARAKEMKHILRTKRSYVP